MAVLLTPVGKLENSLAAIPALVAAAAALLTGVGGVATFGLCLLIRRLADTQKQALIPFALG